MELKKPKKFKILKNVVTFNNVYVGMIVKRGPDWKWGNQDNNQIGTITKVHNPVNESESIWVTVNWVSTGRKFSYRVGPNKFDLYGV